MGKRRRKRDTSSRSTDGEKPHPERIRATPTPTAFGAKRLTRFEDKLTVFWMLTTLFTLATMTLGFGATAYEALRTPSPNDGPATPAVADYARFATAFTSLMLLVSTPIVLKVRQVAPPRAITIFVLAVATVGLAWAFLSGPTSRAASAGERSPDAIGVRSIER